MGENVFISPHHESNDVMRSVVVCVVRQLSAAVGGFGGESCPGRSFLFTSVIIAQPSRTGHDGFHIDLQQGEREAVKLARREREQLTANTTVFYNPSRFQALHVCFHLSRKSLYRKHLC